MLPRFPRTSFGILQSFATKSDAGTYQYDADKINAVTQVNPFQNITLNTQNVFYTPYQQPDKIQENGNQTIFTYAPDYARRKTVRSLNGVNKETRYFFGNYEKQIIAGAPAVTNEIHYIPGGDGLCAIIVRSAGVDKTYATYSDHLGTLTALINTANATDVVYQNFDPWGRRRNPTTWTFTTVPTPPVWLYRGFTFHEELPTFALVNMNGRMYDPVLARMLSPDNEVQSPEYTQSYNRYTYVFNNPLKYKDPSGETGEGWIENEYGSIYWDANINSQYDFDRRSLYDPSLENNRYVGQYFDNGQAWGNGYGEGGYYHNNNSLGMSFAQQSYLANTAPNMRQPDMSWAYQNDAFGIGYVESDEDRQRHYNMSFPATGGVSTMDGLDDPFFNVLTFGMAGRTSTAGRAVEGAGWMGGKSTILGADATTARNAARMIPEEGVHQVLVHGTGLGFGNTGKIGAKEMARTMLNNGFQRGTPIRAISCWTGTLDDGAAYQLSRYLKSPVTAPTNRVRILANGSYEIDGNGVWRTFFNTTIK